MEMSADPYQHFDLQSAIFFKLRPSLLNLIHMATKRLTDAVLGKVRVRKLNAKRAVPQYLSTSTRGARNLTMFSEISGGDRFV